MPPDVTEQSQRDDELALPLIQGLEPSVRPCGNFAELEEGRRSSADASRSSFASAREGVKGEGELLVELNERRYCFGRLSRRGCKFAVSRMCLGAM